MGNEYDLNEVTQLLNVSPSNSWNKGEKIRNSQKQREYTGWIYSTDIIETLDVNTAVKKIEELFMSKVGVICGLKRRYELDISIDVSIVIENEEPPAVYFENEFLQFISQIGARLDIDMYVN